MLPFLVFQKKNFPVIFWKKTNRGPSSWESHKELLMVIIWTQEADKRVRDFIKKNIIFVTSDVAFRGNNG